MPLSGWMLVRDKGLPVFYTLVAGGYGALGCTIGSALAYMVGIRGGRPFLERYGRYLLIRRDDLEAADKWFARYGNWAAFISRLLPVVRTFISLPAGIAAMNFPRFLVYTFTGSFIWCAALAYGGYLLGEHWDQIRSVMRPFDPVIGILIAALIGYYIYRHVTHFRNGQKSQ